MRLKYAYKKRKKLLRTFSLSLLKISKQKQNKQLNKVRVGDVYLMYTKLNDLLCIITVLF